MGRVVGVVVEGTESTETLTPGAERKAKVEDVDASGGSGAAEPLNSGATGDPETGSAVLSPTPLTDPPPAGALGAQAAANVSATITPSRRDFSLLASL